MKIFIREKEKSSEPPEKIAEFLDKLGKNKTNVDLNSLELSSTKQIDQLHEKIDSLQNEMRALFRYQQTKNYEEETADLYAIKAKRQTQEAKKTINFPRRQPNRQNNQGVETFPPHWELNRYGRPFRCRKCGLRGHRDENCTGTDFVCRICNKIGHIQPACPERKHEISKN